MMKNDNALFYLCSLIEFIGRQQKLRRRDVVNNIGEKTLRRIYSHADILHCEPIEKTTDDFIVMCDIPEGGFDNVASCKYEVPDYWTIGEVYERLIEDVCEDDVIAKLIEVYNSWIDREISNYNSDLFYQPRDYLRECYLAGKIL